MNASWGQKYQLYLWATEKKLTNVHAELEAREITQQPMSIERYKRLRNAILFNQPVEALKIINLYPVKGGE